MCNGYPSLRCSRHAKNLLTAAESKLNGAATWEEKEEATRIYDRALKIFYTTPAGFKDLEEQIKTTDNDLKKDELFGLLFEGKKIRREARAESLRIKHSNKTKIEHAALMRKTGLPWWVIASQLNIEFLEKENETKIINSNGVHDAAEKHNTYCIDLKTQSFFITLHNDSVEPKNYISISNHHSQIIYDDTKHLTSSKNIFAITDYYRSRGENKPIEFSELLQAQKTQVVEAVKNSFMKDEIDEIIVSDPKIGFSRTVKLNEIEKNFDITLYTPLSLHNGTDPLTEKSFNKFVEESQNEIFADNPKKIGNRYIVEATHTLNKNERSVGQFVLVPLKENLYEIKKAGNVRGVTARCVLTLKSENS